MGREDQGSILTKKLNACSGSKSEFIKNTVDGERASRIFWFPNYHFLHFLLTVKDTFRALSYNCLFFFPLEGRDQNLDTCSNHLLLSKEQKKIKNKYEPELRFRHDGSKAIQLKEVPSVHAYGLHSDLIVLGRRDLHWK